MNDKVYLLSNFSSLFEVAVGLNLVFSFWESLRNMAAISLNVIADDLRTKLAGYLGSEFTDSRISSKFDSKMNGFSSTLKKISNCAKWLGIACTALMIFLLILIGCDNSITVNANLLILIIFLAVCISPLFLVAGNIYVNYSKSMLTEFVDTHMDVMNDVVESNTLSTR